MLHLIRPDRSMARVKSSARAIELAVAHGADLSKLDWQPAEKPADDLIVSLALRYGVKCSAGIVLDAAYVVLRRYPLEITETHQKAAESHAALLQEQGALMDKVLPGWSDRKRELDARVDESHRQVVEDAEKQLEQALTAKERDTDLVTHWINLGGLEPPR
ncbi:hypothetical protein AB0L34_09655 [Micromonospora sp. NPDC052213]|uniref:hypothetical protein n=1 Tax=Micromonospora sp. NPDC052213 TaxID=3155812 RepID=UPI0034252267